MDFKYITVHCSATPPHMDIGADEIREMHMAKGWRDIGYYFVVRRDGTLEKGRSMRVTGAHVKGHNAGNIGICMVGGVDRLGQAEDNFTPEQFDTLRDFISDYCSIYGIPLSNVMGHRDWFGDTNGDGVIDSRDWFKECPSFSVKNLLATWM